jgi:ABC-type Fe3+/spermidine/putrescine transport system ATPase subunit
MNAGCILQTGVPRELYERPALTTVARFLGRNNLILARRLTSTNEPLGKFRTIEGEHTLLASTAHAQLGAINKNCTLAIRPEHLIISKEAPRARENVIERAIIREITFEGATTSIRLDAQGLSLEALRLSPDGFAVGDVCAVELPPMRITIPGADES